CWAWWDGPTLTKKVLRRRRERSLQQHNEDILRFLRITATPAGAITRPRTGVHAAAAAAAAAATCGTSGEPTTSRLGVGGGLAFLNAVG
ncbi:unnamed protein product, partial [Ectocarpus sp. 6 AP-2014]